MKHILHGIVLSLFFQAFFILADDVYPHDLSDARWHHSGNRFFCLLKNQVPGLGDVSLTAEAGDRETLSMVPDPFSDNDRQVTVSLASSPWQAITDDRVVARTRLYEGDPLSIHLNTLALMKAFQQGKQLKLQITTEASKDVVIQVTPLEVQQVAEQFYRCMDDLLLLSFDQAEHNTFYYSSGKLRLDSGQRELLSHIAEYVMADPSVQQVTIDAHTDSYGHELANRALSKKRSEAVAASLKQMGVPGDKILMRFHGERYPVADNRTKAGRDKNRRVEIWLKR
ncbi:OmpA family protein [Thalassotalea sp. G20_0]|uniref:MotY family protein n=1 Tax=Thalassotalea sp. G20_0 TaxID=2821093 RepID=UPI001ADA6529|nr:OmpA family protein [Thalassotalea sp. G20_0]MBO9495240.1 OmpA family protein [Thalassotalea sp. G20_0]